MFAWLAVFAMHPTRGAPYDWGSATTGGNWSTTTGWSPTAPSGGPGSADTATLGNATTDRTVTVDAAAAATVGGVAFDQSDAFTNELLVRRNFTITDAIVLGASVGTEQLATLPGTGSSITLTASGGITINAGGELVLGVLSAAGGTRVGQFTGNVTLAGGSLVVAPTVQDGGTGTGGTNTLTGAFTMTAGTLAIDRGATTGDRRLSLAGDVSITGGGITSPNGGGQLELAGGSLQFAPTSISSSLGVGLRGSGDQALTFGVPLTNAMNVSSTSSAGAVKTITSTDPASATIGALSMIDQNSSGTDTGVTIRLGSDLSTGSATLPFAASFSQTAQSGRIDMGIDAATHTFDMSGNSGNWTPNASSSGGVTNTVWSLSGNGGTIKARGFNLSTDGTTTNVGPGLTLESAGPSGVANILSGTGTIDSTAVFRYSGGAAVSSPATLTSTRAVGRLEVTSGALRLDSLAGVGSTPVVLSAGGTLIVPNDVDNTAVGGFLSNGSSSFASGSTLAFDTATGGSAGDRDYASAIGGDLGLTKLGTNTLTLSAANAFTGTAKVEAGTLAITADQSATERAYFVGIGGVNLASAASLTTAAGADLAASSFTLDAAAGDPVASATIASGVTNAGSLSVTTRGGSLTIANGGSWTQQGPITVATSGGRVSTVNVQTGGSLTNTGDTITLNPALNNTGRADLLIAGGTLTTNGGFQRAVAGTGGGTARVVLSAGGALAISQSIPDLVVGSQPVTFDVGTDGGTLDTGSFSTAISADITGAGRLTKAGSGTLTLSGANSFAGTTIAAGTVALAGGDNRLATAQSVTFGSTSRLALGTTNQTVSALTTAEFQSVAATITGSGTLTISGTSDTLLGPNGASQPASYDVAYDLSGLSSLEVNTASRTFRVGMQGTTASGSIQPSASLTLGPSASITANLLAVADQGGNATGGSATLTLGAANTINANTINVGYSGRSSGAIEFAPGGSPTLTVRGVAGGTAALPQWLVSRVSSNNDVAWSSTVDLSGGSLDAIVTTLEIGTANATVADRRGTANGSFTMGAGTLTVGTLRIGTVDSSGAGTVSASGPLVGNGRFTLANAAGLVEATSVELASNTIATSTGPARATSGTLTISAGTLRAGAIGLGPQTGTATSVTAALNWTGGTIENLAGSDLAITAVPIAVSSGTASLHATGTNIITVASTAPISGTGGLAKTGSGSLLLQGSHPFTGSMSIAAGTLGFDAGASLAAAAFDVEAGATLDATALTGGLTLGSSQSLGGAGSILGDLVFGLGSKLAFSTTDTLAMTGGTASFASGTPGSRFGIDDLLGLDATTPLGTYTLISGTVDMSNLDNLGAGNAFSLGDGRSAYFQQASLQVVVVPEPMMAVVGAAAVAMAGLARQRRRGNPLGVRDPQMLRRESPKRQLRDDSIRQQGGAKPDRWSAIEATRSIRERGFGPKT